VCPNWTQTGKVPQIKTPASHTQQRHLGAVGAGAQPGWAWREPELRFLPHQPGAAGGSVAPDVGGCWGRGPALSQSLKAELGGEGGLFPAVIPSLDIPVLQTHRSRHGDPMPAQWSSNPVPRHGLPASAPTPIGGKEGASISTLPPPWLQVPWAGGPAHLCHPGIGLAASLASSPQMT
jgi:hypothetical protein